MTRNLIAKRCRIKYGMTRYIYGSKRLRNKRCEAFFLLRNDKTESVVTTATKNENNIPTIILESHLTIERLRRVQGIFRRADKHNFIAFVQNRIAA